MSELIYRDEAIRAVYDKDIGMLTQWDIGRNNGIDYAIKQLEKLPPAQPETAKRIVGKSRGGMTLWYQCDACNEPVDAQDNFCRGCGRRLIDE